MKAEIPIRLHGKLAWSPFSRTVALILENLTWETDIIQDIIKNVAWLGNHYPLYLIKVIRCYTNTENKVSCPKLCLILFHHFPAQHLLKAV
jgi:hypothetical protein